MHAHTASNLICTVNVDTVCVFVSAILKNSKCMCNGNALKWGMPDKSVNQCACVSAEDCRTEVLTLQEQR